MYPIYTLFYILDGQHREVITLFGIGYKLFDGVEHILDDCLRLCLVSLQETLCQSDDSLVAKLLVTSILGFVESVGI